MTLESGLFFGERLLILLCYRLFDERGLKLIHADMNDMVTIDSVRNVCKLFIYLFKLIFFYNDLCVVRHGKLS